MKMEMSIWKIAIIIMAVSFISAAIILVWFFKKVRPVKKETIKGSIRDAIEPDYKLKRWRFLAISWPLVCFIFAGIILSQPGRGGEQRVVDAVFAVFPLIFFAIGMKIQRRLLKEKRYATALASATVVSIEQTMHIGEGNKRCYFPEYEFQVGEMLYRVKSPSGFSQCYVKKGQRVELYYAPENPKVFYVPVMQKHDKRWGMLLCGVGMVFSLVGLFAPQIRAIVFWLN